MTPTELTAIEAITNAASPGPWYAPGAPDPPMQAVLVCGVAFCTIGPGNREVEPDDDDIFIAAAREAVPALVAEVRRLRKWVMAVGNMCESWSSEAAEAALKGAPAAPCSLCKDTGINVDKPCQACASVRGINVMTCDQCKTTDAITPGWWLQSARMDGGAVVGKCLCPGCKVTQ